MSNSIGPTGITTDSLTDIITEQTTDYQTVYGANINLAPNTPDGQMMYIRGQAVVDLLDLIVMVNAMFDPDQAVGVILDQRVAFNGIQRLGGTYTVTPVSLTISVAAGNVVLPGLDQTTVPPYTVADNAGTQWELITSTTVTTNGTYSFLFQAAQPGQVLSNTNTITFPVTIVLGVTSINNPSIYTTLGEAEETDNQLKIRRQKSVSLASQGFYAGLVAALLNISGVSSAFVYENDTSATDGDGTPSHTIWVIVAGTGAAASIANAIYTKRGTGAGMRGAQSYGVTRPDGSTFLVYWDIVSTLNVFTQFTVTSLNGINPPNISAILTGLPNAYVPGVYQEININQLATYVQQIDPNTLVTGAGFSTAQQQTITFSAIAASGTYELTYNGNTSAPISFNDVSLLSKIQAVSGLSGVTLINTTSTAYTIQFPSGTSVQGLIGVTANSLVTAGSAPVSVTPSVTYTPVLTPSSKQYQFTFTAANTVITPMILSPSIVTLVHSTSQTFTGLGGLAPFTYSMMTSGSGSPAVNSSTGAYTAGASPGTDVVKVTDSLGNTATATVTVT